MTTIEEIIKGMGVELDATHAHQQTKQTVETHSSPDKLQQNIVTNILPILYTCVLKLSSGVSKLLFPN